MSDSLGPDEVTRLTDPMVMRAQTRVGQVLKEKWRLDVLLGVGGMAAVYAATHRNGSRVAMKILHPELSTHHEVRTRFLREGYAANAVGHEGAVRVTDDDVAEDGSAFLVMELLDGETLEDRRIRSGGQLGEDEVLSVADQLLDVLVAAHAKGVIHRDIKPDNIFLTRSGQVKVLDFGIARLREVTSKSTATVSGATMGTPAFMSPEQARGLWDEVDGRSDLWAVGATMFNLLTGRVVHDGRTTNEQLLHAMTKTRAAGVGAAERNPRGVPRRQPRPRVREGSPLAGRRRGCRRPCGTRTTTASASRSPPPRASWSPSPCRTGRSRTSPFRSSRSPRGCRLPASPSRASRTATTVPASPVTEPACRDTARRACVSLVVTVSAAVWIVSAVCTAARRRALARCRPTSRPWRCQALPRRRRRSLPQAVHRPSAPLPAASATQLLP